MFELFIAKRIYQNNEDQKQVSRPAIRIAMLGIAIGLAVMIVSVAVVMGFKKEIREQVTGFGAHIQVSNFDSNQSYETQPIATDDSILNIIRKVNGVEHIQRFSMKPGIIKTDEDFQGMVLKGVGPEYDMEFYQKHLLEGEIPLFSDSSANNQILISRSLADKLKLKLEDRIYTYYIENDIRARRLTIKGIYQTNFSEYDNLFLIGDLYTVNRLNQWESDQASGLEILIKDYSQLNYLADEIGDRIDTRMDKYGGIYFTETIEEKNPQLFAWLDLLDMNIWVILILMIGVAGFTMISGLLIIILERTNMIGILKALGAKDAMIRKIFLYFSGFLIGKGIIIGNLIGLAICLCQKYFHIIKLDPVTYQVESVPIELNLWIFLLINISTFLVSLLMLIGPSYLITKISPAKSIRFE